MFGKRKKELITENYNTEKISQNPNPEQAKNIGQATFAYTQAAKWFEENVADGYKKKAKNAKRLCVFFAVLSFMSIGALLGITPLKTVEPYVIRVDNNSGYTDIVRPGENQDTQTVDDEFWLSTYVIARESYNFSTQDARYKTVELMSYDGTFTEYKNFQLSHKGYLEVLGDKGQIRTEINNIVFTSRDEEKHSGTAQVRLTRIPLDENGVPLPDVPATTWLAVVSYDYGKPPVTKKDEWINPRGFGVRAYSTSEEVKVNP